MKESVVVVVQNKCVTEPEVVEDLVHRCETGSLIFIFIFKSIILATHEVGR